MQFSQMVLVELEDDADLIVADGDDLNRHTWIR